MKNEEVRALITEMRGYAANPCSLGYAPIWPSTLRRYDDVLTALLKRAAAAESALATVRRDTLEEAAKLAMCWPDDEHGYTDREKAAAFGIASRIRALAEQPK